MKISSLSSKRSCGFSLLEVILATLLLTTTLLSALQQISHAKLHTQQAYYRTKATTLGRSVCEALTILGNPARVLTQWQPIIQAELPLGTLKSLQGTSNGHCRATIIWNYNGQQNNEINH